jgi:hypothetical protein
MPATYTWVGAMGGIWDNPANWLAGQVPKTGTAEIDFVPAAVPQTITLLNDDVNFQVDSIKVEAGSYTLVGRAPNANQPFTLSNGAVISINNDGRLSFGTPVSLAGAGTDSLPLVFLGAAAEMGTGTVLINNQLNASQAAGLSQFAIDSGTLALGSSTSMARSFFAMAPGATVLVPSGSDPSIGSLSGSGNVQMGDVAGLANVTSLSINTPTGETDTLAGAFIPGPAAAGQVAGGTVQMNGPGSLTVGSLDPASQGQFQIDVAGGTLNIASMANAQTLTVAAGATFGGPATSTFSGPATIAAASNLSISLNGTGAGTFTQIKGTSAAVPASVELTGANLAVSVRYNPMPGDTFTIISAPNGSIAGQFANAPSGATITPTGSSLPFLVAYNKGPGGPVNSVTLKARAAATKTTIGSSENPSVYGQVVTFTTNVTASTGVVPTGTVQLVVDGTNFGAPVSLVNGSASIGDNALSVSGSSHAISAVYTPSSPAFSRSRSTPPLRQMITPYAFTYAIADDGQTYETPANLPADLGTTVNTGVNGQNLVITYSSTGDTNIAHAGKYDITATLSSGTGALSDYVVSLVRGTLTVNPYAFRYAIADDSQTYGTPANLPGDLGTTVNTGVNGQNLAIAYSSTGDTNVVHAGKYAITATLSSGTGLLSDYAVTLVSGTLTVNQVTTSVTLISASADPSVYGQRVTFVAMVTTNACSTGPNSGRVAFYHGKPGAGGIEIGSPQVLSSGRASVTTSTLSGNTIHAIYAVYFPDSNGGTIIVSQPVSQKVAAANTVVRVVLVPVGLGRSRLYEVQAQVTTSVPGLVPTGAVSVRINGGRARTKALTDGIAILETSRARPVNQVLVVTFRGNGDQFSTSYTQTRF